MAYVVGDIIEAADYNSMVSVVNDIWGIGSGDRGYFQSSPLSTVSVGVTVGSAEWTALRDRVNTIALHQGTSTALLPAALEFGVGETVEAHSSGATGDGLSQLVDPAPAVGSIDTNRLNAAPASMSLNAGITSTRSTVWSTVLTHEITVEFASENEARGFFNSGGEIRYTAGITGVGLGAPALDWQQELSDMGTIRFNYTSTTSTGDGTESAIGYYDLTASYQEVFRMQTSAAYAANYMTIQARRENFLGANGGNGRTIRFLVTFDDATVHAPDEVNGTLTSDFQTYIATTYLTHSAPTYTNVSTL